MTVVSGELLQRISAPRPVAKLIAEEDVIPCGWSVPRGNYRERRMSGSKPNVRGGRSRLGHQRRRAGPGRRLGGLRQRWSSRSLRLQWRQDRLYRNNGNGTFFDIGATYGLNDSGTGIGAAWADYDGDGDLDLYLANYCSANRFYRNDGVGPRGGGNHWLLVDLVGTQSNRAGIGAKVRCVAGGLNASREIYANVPNPLNPVTTIRFDLPSAGTVHLTVFDATGRVVRRLLDAARYEAGPHDAIWDGRTDQGSPVASGIYFYRIVAGDFRATRRIALLK